MADGAVARPERGPASAVDLLSRLRGPLPDPEPVRQIVVREELWEPVTPTGHDLVDLRRELEAARMVAVPFDDAWPVALRRVLATIPTAVGFKSPRATFKTAAVETRQAWQDAYENVGEPLRFVGGITAALEADEDDAVVGGPRPVRSSW